MLTPVDDLAARIDEFWPIAQDVTRSAYPTYADGIKTYDDFARHVRQADRSDWGEVLLHGDDAMLLIEAEDDAHVSLRLWAKGPQAAALDDALAYLHRHYSGYTLWLGFAPENAEMLAFAKDNDFVLLDDLINWTLHLKKPVCTETSAVRVTEENYSAFRELWTDDAVYWNADRIRKALDRWMVFITPDGRAAVACMNDEVVQEIFGFQYRDGYDEKAHRTLMAAVIREACDRGAKHLTYFSGHGEERIMHEMDFCRVSDYVCYELKL